MEEQLQHDPRTKRQIKDLLYNFLYLPVENKLQQQLNNLITRNANLAGNANYSFRYKGKIYSIDPYYDHKKINSLAQSLHPMMVDYLRELEELNSIELPYVVGFLNQVLNSSNSLQDYLKVLPEAIHRPIQHLMNTCPCKTCSLKEADVEEIKQRNQNSIDLIKQRLVMNLLI